MEYILNGFPRQALPRSKKTKDWAEKCVRFAEQNTVLSSSLIRKTVAHKKINYDLLSGKLNMADMELIINPEGIDYGVPTKAVQHYPVMNNMIMLLLGEERASQFDYKVIVTNPNAVSEIENNKKREVMQSIQELTADQSINEEEYNQKMQSLNDYYSYEWQDLREIRANCLLNHYSKEQNFDNIFNDGMVDFLTVNEEIYQWYVESGEPVLRRLNPCKVYSFGSGYSYKIEDSSMIVLEDYLPINRIVDIWHDKLSEKDIKKLENLYEVRADDTYGDKGDPRNYFIWGQNLDQYTLDDSSEIYGFDDGVTFKNLPYDIAGNVRVLQVYWKSLRKIKEVKWFDPVTGESQVKLEDETYVLDENLGETEKPYYINEAWHGVMIGAGENAIFVDIGPCQIQYNRLSNPSKCHFGIIGTIGNFNENQPYSLVDMIKPLQYMYDAVADRLNKLMGRNMGKILQLNLSQVPAGWTLDKWLYYIKTNGLAVIDPMREGNIGIAKGKMAGMFPTAPVIDTELGNSIQNMVNFLEYTQNQMAEITGVTKQRQGQIANRETVGGVERSTLQSSHTTRWYFAKHEDTKKRVLECGLETAKMCMKGKSKKFSYILPDMAQRIMDVDGDAFAECDYGLVIDSGYDMQSLNQDIQQIAQAAMQNQILTFSAYLKLKSNCSLAEKIRMLENAERRTQESVQQAQQQQSQAQQATEQAKMQLENTKLQLTDTMNQRDNDTKLLIANMNALAAKDADGSGIVDNNLDSQKLNEQLKEFSERLDLDRERLEFERQKHQDNTETKIKIAKMNKNKPVNK